MNYGRIRYISNNVTHELKTDHRFLIGRDKGCNIVLSDDDIEQCHVVVCTDSYGLVWIKYVGTSNERCITLFVDNGDQIILNDNIPHLIDGDNIRFRVGKHEFNLVKNTTIPIEKRRHYPLQKRIKTKNSSSNTHMSSTTSPSSPMFSSTSSTSSTSFASSTPSTSSKPSTSSIFSTSSTNSAPTTFSAHSTSSTSSTSKSVPGTSTFISSPPTPLTSPSLSPIYTSSSTEFLLTPSSTSISSSYSPYSCSSPPPSAIADTDLRTNSPSYSDVIYRNHRPYSSTFPTSSSTTSTSISPTSLAETPITHTNQTSMMLSNTIRKGNIDDEYSEDNDDNDDNVEKLYENENEETNGTIETNTNETDENNKSDNNYNTEDQSKMVLGDTSVSEIGASDGCDGGAVSNAVATPSTPTPTTNNNPSNTKPKKRRSSRETDRLKNHWRSSAFDKKWKPSCKKRQRNMLS
eukprot:TRINITY_DN3208_c0_g1_i2.p1 TRINITY_DN3208_c0_g1~~TRINITY_DN3208_c0_g1_i2.p1  ORF type:complete len:462 (+),score=113.13 TRINITY_DN3208_c0_g1_i2:653-2038(+)